MLTTIDIVFHSNGVPLAGRFFRNTDDLATRRSCLIVTGSWLTVKEQMATTYARKLADMGFNTFVFDFSGFGASGGEPRQAEMPARKIADIISAAEFLRTFSFVDAQRIGHLAICASAQYALAALAAGAPIAAFASVAGWYHDAASIAGFYGGANGVSMRIARAEKAITAYLKDGTTITAPAYADGDDRAGMFFTLPYYARADRGAIPEWKNAMAEMTWLYWLSFDGLAAAERVPTPTLLFHSDDCALPAHVRLVHERLKGPRQLVWSTGAQVDFYDLPDHVERALAVVGPWFNKTLR
jgi:uncharacterized protein